MTTKDVVYLEIENDEYHNESVKLENLLVKLPRKSKSNIYGKMVGSSCYILIVTLNVNGLNSAIER